MRRVVFLERQALGSVDRCYAFAFRLAVKAERQPFYANPSATSADRFAPPEEIAALKAGEYVEVVDIITAPPAMTDEQAQTALAGSLARRQAELDARNPFDRYGSSFDGTTWTMVEVP